MMRRGESRTRGRVHFGTNFGLRGINWGQTFALFSRASIELEVCCPQCDAAIRSFRILNVASFLMKIHEYQGKAILKKYGVCVPRGSMAATRDEAEAVARELLSAGSTGVVVKAQI